MCERGKVERATHLQTLSDGFIRDDIGLCAIDNAHKTKAERDHLTEKDLQRVGTDSQEGREEGGNGRGE